MNKLLFFVLIIFLGLQLNAQKITPEEYVFLYKDLAIREMKRMGVPAAITLAQGILETENGNSVLVKKSNNHFGIKCKGSWTAEGVSHDDDLKGECFRSYKTAEDSYRDHSNFLRGNQRYRSLFDLNAEDYQGWCYGLKKAGYATNPKYPQTLIYNIEKYNLNQYTLAAIKEVAKFDGAAYKSDSNNIHNSISVPIPGTAQSLTSVFDKKQKTYFNGLKAVYAKKGTSLLLIANIFEIPLVKLYEFNDLREDSLLKEEQWVFLETKREQGGKEFYFSQENETLYDIAQNNAMKFKSLLAYNNLSADSVLLPGSKLRLQPIISIVEKVELKDNKKNIHIVQEKESLYAIARKYAITVQQIKEWNKLGSDDLKIGQEIIIAQ